MDESYFRKTISVILLASLLVLSFFTIKPLFTSIVISFLLAFIFTPVYNQLNKYLKSPNISASLIILFMLIIIITSLWFLTPLLIRESFDIFQKVNNIDFISPLKSILPDLFASEQFAKEIGSVISSFTSNLINQLIKSLAGIIFDFPVIMLHLFVIFFTLFFLLRDREIFIDYIKSVLPFSKEVEEKLFQYTRDVTASIIYGEFVVGLLQGIILGIGLFVFQVPNWLFFAFLAMVLGILPIIGTAILWIPLAISLFSVGNNIAAWGIIIFGVISSNIDNLLRPLIISRRTKINSSLVLISMIGGALFLGPLGFILGPLIISYFLIFIEIYRGKAKKPVLIIQEPSSK